MIDKHGRALLIEAKNLQAPLRNRILKYGLTLQLNKQTIRCCAGDHAQVVCVRLRLTSGDFPHNVKRKHEDYEGTLVQKFQRLCTVSYAL